MKKLIIVSLVLYISIGTQAQKLVNTKWYEYYLGGKKGFFTKIHSITKNTLTINQSGGGNSFDNKPSTLSIEHISTVTDERMITKYDDSTYMVIVIKKITTNKAQACVNLKQFKSVQEATAYLPKDNDFTTWYTEAGYKIENSKPAMPIMTKKDMIDFSNFLVGKLKEKSKILDTNKAINDDKEFALAMHMVAAPFEYAENKGFNAYKSLSVFEKGITKFKNDAMVIKIFIDAGFGNMLTK